MKKFIPNNYWDKLAYPRQVKNFLNKSLEIDPDNQENESILLKESVPQLKVFNGKIYKKN
jgi:hypothetical protein